VLSLDADGIFPAAARGYHSRIVDDQRLARALGGALAAHFGREVGVRGLELLAGGASRRIFGFEAEVAGEAAPLSLVARFDALPGRIRGSGVDEYALVDAAYEHGVAVARVYCRGRVADVETPVHHGERSVREEEHFYVMQRLAGQAIARRLLRESSYAQARDVLPQQLAHSLARIHAIDTGDPRVASLRVGVGLGAETVEQREAESAPEPLGDFACSEIERYRSLLAAAAPAHPMPVLSLTARWLERHRPPLTKEAVVHGDFRIGNVMFDEQGLTGVLDWELAHLGDPLEDLGWLAVRAWRFGNDDRPIGGLCSREEFWALYEREGGVRVDPAAARYWEIFGNWKWAIICVMQGASHKAGPVPDVELAAIGRRVAETEWEILSLLEENDRAG
jgi:aminoglycoside phosphotransferase (APT) family kinase protein